MKRLEAQLLAVATVLSLTSCVGQISGTSVPTTGPDGRPVPTGRCQPAGGKRVTLGALRRLSAEAYRASLEAVTGPLDLPSERLSLPRDVLPADLDVRNITGDELDLLMQDAELAAEALTTSRADGFDACAKGTSPDQACARRFLARVGLRLARRPLSDASLDALVATRDRESAASTPKQGLRTAVARLILSPEVSYQLELGTPSAEGLVALDGYQKASRLSLLLQGRAPDAALLEAVQRGDLDAPGGARAIAEQWLKASNPDARAQAQLRTFYERWLGLPDDDERRRMPNLSGAAADALGVESQAFFQEVVLTQRGSVSQVLNAGFTFVNADLASHYGLSGITGTAPQKFESSDRVGLLQQGATLLPHAGSTAPRRGKMIYTRLACGLLGSPPPGAAATPLADLPTMRQRFAAIDATPGCAVCHSVIAPTGYALERFDGVGRMRETERDTPIDTAVTIPWLKGGVEVAGAADLSAQLATAPEVLDCAAFWTFRNVHGRMPSAYDSRVGDDADFCALEDQRAVSEGLVEQLLSWVDSDDFSFTRFAN